MSIATRAAASITAEFRRFFRVPVQASPEEIAMNSSVMMSGVRGSLLVYIVAVLVHQVIALATPYLTTPPGPPTRTLELTLVLVWMVVGVGAPVIVSMFTGCFAVRTAFSVGVSAACYGLLAFGPLLFGFSLILRDPENHPLFSATAWNMEIFGLLVAALALGLSYLNNRAMCLVARPTTSS